MIFFRKLENVLPKNQCVVLLFLAIYEIIIKCVLANAIYKRSRSAFNLLRNLICIDMIFFCLVLPVFCTLGLDFKTYYTLEGMELCYLYKTYTSFYSQRRPALFRQYARFQPNLRRGPFPQKGVHMIYIALCIQPP